MIIIDTYYIVNSIYSGNNDRMSTYLILIPLLLVPMFMKKILKININIDIEIIYLLFVFLAQVFGSVINLYNTISWYDTFMHFISGILSSLLALILLIKFKIKPEKNIFLTITYILGFVFLIASLWECFEFTFDQVTGSNLQHAYETGVKDTMKDIIIAFAGSVIFLIAYFKEKKNGFIHRFIYSKSLII